MDGEVCVSAAPDQLEVGGERVPNYDPNVGAATREHYTDEAETCPSAPSLGSGWAPQMFDMVAAAGGRVPNARALTGGVSMGGAASDSGWSQPTFDVVAVGGRVPNAGFTIGDHYTDEAVNGPSAPSSGSGWSPQGFDMVAVGERGGALNGVVSVDGAALESGCSQPMLGVVAVGGRVPNAAAANSADDTDPDEAASCPRVRSSYAGWLQQMFDATSVSPEKPFAFPDDPISMMAAMVCPHSGEKRWPRIVLTIFKSYRIADSVYENILANMTPRLLSAFIRICRAIEVLFPRRESPTEPRDWLMRSIAWEDSVRCGVQTMRLDSSFGVVSGLDVNRFWTDVAGLHKEEFVNRAFNGENLMPTSELRQTAKILDSFANTIRFFLAAKESGAKMNLNVQTPPMYCRFTRNWGRGLAQRDVGLLVRMQFTRMTDPDGWLYVRNSMVVISPEEYEVARKRNAGVCEGFMIPLVGSKSAAELLDERLEQEESFAWLNSRPEGRAVLDRFADKLDRDFAFVFDALDRLRASAPAPSVPAPYY